MPRESLRHAIPSSYDEEMEQLRIALEISARASTSHDVHASSSARNSLRQSAAPHVTTSPRFVNGSGASTRTAGRTGRVLVDDARARRPARARDDFADDDDDARATLAERLERRHGVSARDAQRVVDVLDGDYARAEDVCLIVKMVPTSVDRAIAHLRNVGWDVDLALSRMLDASKTSPNAETEREELKRRARSMRRPGGDGKADEARTVKQNLNYTPAAGHRESESGFSSASFRASPSSRARDEETERYHRERWESEISDRAAQANKAKSKWDSSQPTAASTPRTASGSEHARETLRSEPPKPSHSAPRPSRASDPPLATLEREGLVQVLTALGVEPSSSSITAVRSAYRKAALRFHPDRLSAAGALERSYKSDVWKLLSSKMDAYAP